MPTAWVAAHLPAPAGGEPGITLAAWTGRSLELPWPPPEAAVSIQDARGSRNGRRARESSRWQSALHSAVTKWGALAAAAALIVALVPRALPPQGQAMVAIDINPSLELMVDGRSRVTAATPRNDDARRVLADLALRGLPLETATDRILERVIALGYLAPGKDNVILASVVPIRGGGTPDAGALQQSMAAHLQTAGLKGYVSARIVAAPVRGEARQAGLSVNQELVRQALVQQGIPYTAASLAAESPKQALQAAGLDVTAVFSAGEQVGADGAENPRQSGEGEAGKRAGSGEITPEPANKEGTEQPATAGSGDEGRNSDATPGTGSTSDATTEKTGPEGKESEPTVTTPESATESTVEPSETPEPRESSTEGKKSGGNSETSSDD
ncbi:MAG: anti-sigma-I factor RsgI family protein [Symbiobacteriia bacterium]